MNEELELLKQKRKELDLQIKRLENKTVVYGCAKLDREQYPTQRPDRYYVAIQTLGTYIGRKREVWRTIVNGDTPLEAINKIPTVINDLQELYVKYKNENGEEYET